MDILSYVMGQKSTPSSDASSNSTTVNVNTVQTVTGTLSDPWGDIDITELKSALANQRASAQLTIDGTYLGASGYYYFPVRGWSDSYNDFLSISAYGSGNGSINNANGLYIRWRDGSFDEGEMLRSGSLVQISSNSELLAIPSTVSIVWHPLD